MRNVDDLMAHAYYATADEATRFPCGVPLRVIEAHEKALQEWRRKRVRQPVLCAPAALAQCTAKDLEGLRRLVKARQQTSCGPQVTDEAKVPPLLVLRQQGAALGWEQPCHDAAKQQQANAYAQQCVDKLAYAQATVALQLEQQG